MSLGFKRLIYHSTLILYPEKRINMILRNVTTQVPDYTVSQVRRHNACVLEFLMDTCRW